MFESIKRAANAVVDKTRHPGRQVRSGANDFLSPESVAAWGAPTGRVTLEEKARRDKPFTPLTDKPPKLTSAYDRNRADMTRSKAGKDPYAASRATTSSVRGKNIRPTGGLKPE